MTDDEITAAAKIIYFACSVTGHPSEHEWYGYYMFESIYHKAARALDAAGMLRPVAEPTTRNEIAGSYIDLADNPSIQSEAAYTERNN